MFEKVESFPLENPNLTLRPKEIDILRKIGSGEELAVAVALDKAVNGTNLLLMFQVKKAHLLLSGDAQWGTWHAALEDPQWRELLTKTTFHKVGHHGSHNASPKDLVDNVLGEGVCEMVSTLTEARRRIRSRHFRPRGPGSGGQPQLHQ
jgi:hypothetical protein